MREATKRKNRVVTLSDETVSMAKDIGDGNISEGVRVAVAKVHKRLKPNGN